MANIESAVATIVRAGDMPDVLIAGELVIVCKSHPDRERAVAKLRGIVAENIRATVKLAALVIES